MGSFFSLFKGVKKKDTRVLLLGLDNAGKTTIIKQLGLMKMYTKQQMDNEDDEDIDPSDVVPTVGFNVKEVEFKNLKFAMWDLGGQANIRSLWKHYYKGTNGIIFVVDSSAQDRIGEAKKELESLLSDEELNSVPLLIMGNKNDVNGAMKGPEIIAKFQLEDNMKNRKWFVQSCCALSGDGLYKGLEWFVDIIK